MKKIIYGFAFSVIAASAILVACDKQDVSPNQSVSKKPRNSNLEKSLTDAQLISIINGMNSNYTKIEEVEEVLFDNCQLTSTVLRALIDQSKYPNYIVEEMMILSAPISSADLTYLHTVRPTLSSAAISTAGGVNWRSNEFGVLNSSPRQIVYATGLTRTELCPTSCGESKWHGTNNVALITLTSTTTPLDPADMAPCNSGKWVCGKLVESNIVLNEGATTIVVSRCEGTEDNCIRKVSKTR